MVGLSRRIIALFILSIVLALLISSATIVRPVVAADQTVTNTGDSGPGSLRQAIDEITPGGTITFDPSLSGETITLTSGFLVIDKDLEIDGSDLDEHIIISGGNTFLVFYIYADITVTLDSLSIQNGNAGGGLYGGGIYNKGTLNLLNSVVSNNKATFGGGIYNYQGTLNMTYNSLTSNTADNQGGGIYNYQGTLTITGSNFSENKAKMGSGGGVYNQGTLTFTYSTLTKNTSDDKGGGIYNSDTLNVTSSTFTANTADDGGGGIYNWGTTTITNSALTGNTTPSKTKGGGIRNLGTMTVTNSTFFGNKAGDGGGIAAGAGTLIITNSTLSDNSSEDYGGGIYNTSTLTVTNSTFSDNASGVKGDGILNMGILNYANTIIVNNHLFGDCVNDDGGTIGPTNFNNLVGTGNCGSSDSTADPLLGPLANNGGPTLTHALLFGSPAIDAGNPAYCPETDQRGVSRPKGAGCDIGAFEYFFAVYLPVVSR